MMRSAGRCGKIGQSGCTRLLKPSASRNCQVNLSQRLSVGGTMDQEMFGEILSGKTNKTSNGRRTMVESAGFFGSMDFVDLKNKNTVKAEIKDALNASGDNQIEELALKVIKSCGGSWFDIGKADKNNVLTRFMDAYLAKHKITPAIGNRLLLSYTENRKDFDSKLLLKSFLDAGVRPNSGTYCAIIQLEIARGNFQSALDVYKFCTDQNLELIPSVALSLLTGSVAKQRPDLTAEFEGLFDSFSKELDAAGALSKSMAATLGHVERGSTADLEGFLANAALDSSLVHQTQFLKAFCFVYQAIAERKSSDSLAHCKRLLDQMKPIFSPEVSAADKILAVTASHLYANKCVEASLELKKSIPQAHQDQGHQLSFKFSDELFASAVLANDKDPAVMLVSKFRGFKESRILERPLTTLISRSVRGHDKAGNIETVMSSFLENPEVEVKPHFYFPFFIQNADGNLPSVSRVKEFCECWEKEQNDYFRHTAERFEAILRSQPSILNHLLTLQEKLTDYPKLNCVLIQVLLKKQRYTEAALVCDKITSNISAELASRLINTLITEICHGDYATESVAKIFGKCYRCLNDYEKEEKMENLIGSFCEQFNPGVPNRLNNSQDSAGAFFTCLAEEKCLVTPKIMTHSTMRSLARIDSAYQALSPPEHFLHSNVFTRNILSLSADERKAMLDELTSENFASSNYGNLPSHQKEDKITTLNASLGNFEPLEEFLASKNDHNPEIGKTLLSSAGKASLILEILLEADKTELVAEVMKKSPLFNQNSWDNHASFYRLLKSTSQLEAVGEAIISRNRSTVAGSFAQHLFASKQYDLLKNFAEKCISEMHYLYPMYIYYMHVCETESLETCKEIYDTHHKNMSEAFGHGHNLMRQPLVTACVRFSSSPLSKQILADILKTGGSQNENEIAAGDVLLAYLQAGKLDKAKGFAKNRSVQVHDIHLQQVMNKLDTDSVVLLIEVGGKRVKKDGRVHSLDSFVFNKMRYMWNKPVNEEMKTGHRDFCRDVLQTLVDKRIRISSIGFENFHEMANWAGVNVPRDYWKRLMATNRAKFWIAVNNGNVSDAMEAMEKSEGRIIMHSKEISAFVDLIGEGSFPDLNDNHHFVDFLYFNRDRIETAGSKRLISKLLDHSRQDFNFHSLLKAFAASDLNSIHRSLLLGASRMALPAGPFSTCLPFYLTYNNDDFATYAVRNFVERRSARMGLTALSWLNAIDPSTVEPKYSANALSTASSLLKSELLNHFSMEDIERHLQTTSKQSLTVEEVTDEETPDVEPEQVSL